MAPIVHRSVVCVLTPISSSTHSNGTRVALTEGRFIPVNEEVSGYFIRRKLKGLEPIIAIIAVVDCLNHLLHQGTDVDRCNIWKEDLLLPIVLLLSVVVLCFDEEVLCFGSGEVFVHVPAIHQIE